MSDIPASALNFFFRPARAQSRPQQGASARPLFWLVALYLIVALALPVATIGWKSLQTFHFDLSQVELEMQRAGIWQDHATLADWSSRNSYTANDGLSASELSREQVTRILRKSDRSGIDLFRLRDVSPKGGMLMLDGAVLPSGQWVEVSKATLGKVQIRPVMAIGLGNFARYFETPALRQSIVNSLIIASLSTLIIVPLAFVFAYGVTRTCMPLRRVMQLAASVPLLVPSLLPALALVYLFGNQGLFKALLMGHSIYGPIGIVMASVFFVFPHAVLILIVSLSLADARLYEVAQAMRVSPWRQALTITLPSARYGLVSAAFVSFTLVLTDFGVPKVVGGQFNVLALDIYKQVIGQQNFQMGAVVSLVLLLPAIVAFWVERMAARRQTSLLTARSVAYQPRPDRLRDLSFFALCAVISLVLLGVLAMCQLAALFRLWPYNLAVGFWHYDFSTTDGGGWRSYGNSLELAFLVASFGAALVFIGAWLTEKTRGMAVERALTRAMALMPMAIPGMVLGLAYIFFFNAPANPLHGLYGTMAILVICTVVHLYTVPHLTAVSALKQMDPEFEAVSESLRQPFWRTFGAVTVPVCLPAIVEIWIYLFVNAMTTVSAVVFLYSPTTTLASVAVLNMDDAGDISAAAAMGMMIFYTNAAMRLLHMLATGPLLRSTQRWRVR
ncbi:putative 2-aminoethylphosphonate ABC transporter permease subunit [Radicibacter daui]|uniref:putative 2-aminoethylphosphonate ABC transporter permease subunit n=1 Tax=Radicibacter daui TaxID=3064829 RepID=UPI004046DBEA